MDCCRPFLVNRKTRLHALLLCCFGVAGQGLAQEATRSGAPIRINVNRVNIGVTVTSSSGGFVKGLAAKDFQIFDNDAEQPLTEFMSMEDPNQVLVLVETGPAAYAVAKNELDGLETLIDALSPQDKIAVATYAQGPQMLKAFSADRDSAKDAIRKIRISGTLGSINLTSSVLTVLDSFDSLQGRKALVLVSTGVDSSTGSLLALEQRLLTSDIRIFAVSSGGILPKFSRWKVPSAEQREALQLLKKDMNEGYELLSAVSAATGGRSYFPKNHRQFAGAYSDIARTIRGEYWLEFSPPALDGKLHYITVKTKQHRYRVDARRAYLAPLPPGQ
jgi:Ca-activated chloride channel homolog